MGTFVIAQRLSGVYKYEFVSRKGKTIFTSNDFELRFECEEEIEKLKTSLERCVFMRFKSSSGKFFFRLILDEHEIAVSRRYTTQLLLQKGIDEIIRYFGIKLEETMAFGDGGNDITMLRHAAIGVAMGQAKEDVKAAADYVTAPIDEDGISKAMKHFGII